MPDEIETDQPDADAVVPAVDMSRNTWTPQMASAWSGIPYRTLLQMCKEGRCPSIPLGEPQAQKWPKGKSGRRRRACFKYMIPRHSFIRWFQSIGRTGSDGQTAA
jgi:hypothetical protein